MLMMLVKIFEKENDIEGKGIDVKFLWINVKDIEESEGIRK